MGTAVHQIRTLQQPNNDIAVVSSRIMTAIQFCQACYGYDQSLVLQVRCVEGTCGESSMNKRKRSSHMVDHWIF